MIISDLVGELKLPKDTASAVMELGLPYNHFELKTSFFNKTSLFDDFAKADTKGLYVLRLYLQWLTDTKQMYDSRGIPEEYFFDSMKDITIWCEDYLEKHGTPGFAEASWLGKSLRLEVIRIGRLQFEPTVLKQEVLLDGELYPSGTPMLDVHIAAGEPLEIEASLESMSRAPEFFKTYFGREFKLFHCHSWLLSPDLKELLCESSRIIRFSKLFTVYKTDNEERQAEERVFGFISDDPNNYPERTSLQRSVKEHLLKGKTVPMGAGVRKIK